MKFLQGFEKIALSKGALLAAARSAKKKIDVMPPGIRYFGDTKPQAQLKRFSDAASKK